MKGCYGKKQNIHDFLLLYQFLYVLLRTFLIHRLTMKKGLFFIMAFIVACSLCVTNSSCNDKKVDGADSLASDSTLVDTTAASIAQMTANDYQNAQSIYTSMQADAQKSQMNRWKILQDTQTKIFEIQQDVTVNRAKTQDKMFGKWDEYIRG